MAVFALFRGCFFLLFFSFFLAWCCFFSYLCCWFSVLCCGALPLPFGLFRGVGFRLLRRVRLVRSLRSARAARALALVLWAGGGGVSALRLLAVWPVGVFLVGRLGCRFPLCFAGGGVAAFRRRVLGLRPAFAVFVIFFNICLWCGWDAAGL